MKTLHDFTAALDYLNRLGIANPTMPIGWKQHILCTTLDRLEDLNERETGRPYPIRLRYNRGAHMFTVETETGAHAVPAADPHDER